MGKFRGLISESEYIAQNFAYIFIRNSSKIEAAKEIIGLINNLEYKEGGKISNNDIDILLKTTSEFLNGERLWKAKYGGFVVKPKRTDNKDFLELIEYIKKEINKK